MVASSVLLAGLGSVMLIARQVAYVPTGTTYCTEAAKVLSQLTDELQYATLLIGQNPRVLEFVVADRDADGVAERLRYEWSGTNGDPLVKSINGSASVTVLASVANFNATFFVDAVTSTFTGTTDSAEAVLAGNTTVQDGLDRSITATSHVAQVVNPALFTAVPANAKCWNATRIEFYGRKSGSPTGTLRVQMHSSGEPGGNPTSNALGRISIAESALPSSFGWYVADFPSALTGLALHRKYTLTWSQSGSGVAADLETFDGGGDGVLESLDAGASWQVQPTRQMFWRLYGTYTTPGSSYTVDRSYVSHINIVLQAGNTSHSRIDASVPLVNAPELVSAYWRTDFERDPTATNGNGDAVADWVQTGGDAFDSATLIDGVWHAAGALESRPLHDFDRTTIVELRCRNTTSGGNGAVLQINADRQGGFYAPLLMYLQRQPDGTQTLSLHGKSSDVATKRLFRRVRLPDDFVRIRLTIVPQLDVVNVAINNVDQGTFAYPKLAPASSTDRYVTLYTDTSLAEFDYVDVRVGQN